MEFRNMFSNYSKRMSVLLQLMPQVFNWIAIRRLDRSLPPVDPSCFEKFFGFIQCMFWVIVGHESCPLKPEECYVNGMNNAFQFYLLNYSTLLFPLSLIFAIIGIKNCKYQLNCLFTRLVKNHL